MGFLGVYRALYDYTPQAEAELAVREGDLLYVLEKSDEDDWWKVKKKAGAEEDEEPIGLVPNNYIEEAQSIGDARSLYEYTRQTDEELSFPEDAALQIFDTSDPDWILVGLDGDYGFVPANYIEISDAGSMEPQQATPSPPSLPARPPADIPSPGVTPAEYEDTPRSRTQIDGPAAAMAGVLQSQSERRIASPPRQAPEPLRQDTHHDLDEEDNMSPALPARPRSEVATHKARAPPSSVAPSSSRDADDTMRSSSYRSPGGFHMYNVNEMVSVMGKRKKMPTTLGVNIEAKTILIAPEHSRDGPSQEWTGSKMTHYSREGKHVFLELVRPSKSVDFHAGAKDTAEEIVLALAELAASIKADGLSMAILSPTGYTQKRGRVLYDFTAQGDDEVTVSSGDEVIVLDDTKSDEWWQVRRVKNGKEGVMPSSYVEITGLISPLPISPGVDMARSTVEQNRLEEARLTNEAVRSHVRDPSVQVGPGMPLPERGSSLQGKDQHGNSSQQRTSKGGQPKTSKSKPDALKVRTWTDRSKSFSVEAQFLGVKDGKINLHKVNGVKIAVPVAKMSLEDIDYVERVTGSHPDAGGASSRRAKQGGASSQVGASVEPRKPDYDWFQFFLDCDVNVGLCERYEQSFTKESMTESILPDVDASVLRTLGLREGDIIKVMKALDAKFGRTGKANKDAADGEGGLFSGPGGTLRNNTRKGRPAPAVQTTDVVDPKAFAQTDAETAAESNRPASTEGGGKSDSQASPGGFDDNAWDVKPPRRATPVSQPTAAATEKTTTEDPGRSQNLTGTMQDLSLLTTPLQPTPVQTTPTGSDSGPSGLSAAPTQPQTTAAQTQGATPSFFSNLGSTPDQGTGSIRQRPQPPAQTSLGQGTLAPPPARSLSAPHAAQPSAFSPPPLAPQMTGSVHPILQGQVAPPGQSLNEVDQARLREQYLRQLQAPQMAPYGTPILMPFPTGVQSQLAQPHATGSPAAVGPQFIPIQAQPTGFPLYPTQQPFQHTPAGGMNSFLPPALDPQRTGVPGPPAPPAPLVPQQTGPAPSVRFGVKADAPRLAPQPTGRKANLAQATPENPFGF